VEEGGESFPVLIALKGPRSAQKANTSAHSPGSDDDSSANTGSLGSASQALQKSRAAARGQLGWSIDDGGHRNDNASDDGSRDDGDDQRNGHARVVDHVDSLLDSRPTSPVFINDHQYQYNGPHADESRFHRPSLARGHIKGGFLSDMHPEFGQHKAPSLQPHLHKPHTASGIDAVHSILRAPEVIQNSASASASALQSETLMRKLTRRGSAMNLEKSAALTAQALAAMALNKPQPAPVQVQQLARAVSGADVRASMELPGARAPLPPVRSLSTLREETVPERTTKPKSKLVLRFSPLHSPLLDIWTGFESGYLQVTVIRCDVAHRCGARQGTGQGQGS
jgi:hypothetical protein